MTTIQHRWLWIGAGVAAAAAALALGVPLGSVLIVAAVLACPLAMYFGMRGMGMGHESHHEGMDRPPHTSDAGRHTEDRERHPGQRE
jgi:hypothetical protein